MVNSKLNFGTNGTPYITVQGYRIEGKVWSCHPAWCKCVVLRSSTSILCVHVGDITTLVGCFMNSAALGNVVLYQCPLLNFADGVGT